MNLMKHLDVHEITVRAESSVFECKKNGPQLDTLSSKPSEDSATTRILADKVQHTGENIGHQQKLLVDLYSSNQLQKHTHSQTVCVALTWKLYKQLWQEKRCLYPECNWYAQVQLHFLKVYFTFHIYLLVEISPPTYKQLFLFIWLIWDQFQEYSNHLHLASTIMPHSKSLESHNFWCLWREAPELCQHDCIHYTADVWLADWIIWCTSDPHRALAEYAPSQNNQICNVCAFYS